MSEQNSERSVKVINIMKYFPEHEIYIKNTSKQGMRLSEFRKKFPKVLPNTIRGFHLGRYGKPVRLALIFNIDKNWFYISELLRTDGHISKNFDRIKLTNINALLKYKLRVLFRKCGVKYFREKEGDRILLFNRTMALILSKIFNIPAGNKTFTCCMPAFMKNANLDLVSHAVRGAFDGDGCVQLTRGKRGSGATRRVRLYGASTRYLGDIRYCLSRFDIHSQIYKDPRENQTYFLQISQRDDLLRFAQHIGFFHDKRKKLLSKLVASYRNYYFIKEFEKLVIKVLKDRGPVCIHQLARTLKRKDSTASEQVTKLEKKGKVKTIKIGGKRFIFLSANKNNPLT